MALNILIFHGPAQNNGNDAKVVNFVRESIEKRGHETLFVDPVEYDVLMDDDMDRGSAPDREAESLTNLAQMISGADAFVVVTGEQNHGIPKPLTDLMEHFLEEYFFRPSGIISYSADEFGGVRAAMQLRTFLAEMGTVSIPTLIPIPRVQNTFNAVNEPADPDFQQFINQFMDDLEWYAFTLREGRNERRLPY